jgi:hypothetical protein
MCREKEKNGCRRIEEMEIKMKNAQTGREKNAYFCISLFIFVRKCH